MSLSHGQQQVVRGCNRRCRCRAASNKLYAGVIADVAVVRPATSCIFFEIKGSKITRGHNFTLVKNQSRLDVRKFSFSQRSINVWNKLSTECVHASSVNVFKNRIDKYLVKAGYT